MLRDLLLAFIGPLGIFLGWWLPRRDKEADRQLARDNLLREKAVEIYGELDRVQQQSHLLASRAALYYTRGPESPTDPIFVEFGKLRGLMLIYFPSSASIFTDHDKESMEGQKALREAVKAQAEDGFDEKKARQLVVMAAATTQAVNTSTLRRLQEFMDKASASLF